MAATRERVSCGLQINSVSDISNVLTFASQSGYSFIIVPIVHPRFRREFFAGKARNRPGAFTRSDLLLSSRDWNTFIVGNISPWIDVDSSVTSVRRNSEKALEQELQYASHLGIPAVVISPRNHNCVNLARIVYDKLLGSAGHQLNYNVWIHIPMQAPSEEAKMFINSSSEGNEAENDEPVMGSTRDTWEWWHLFRTVCNSDKRLGLMLEISADLPCFFEIERWLGETIRCVAVNTNIFLTNKKGFPVLSRAHQNLLKRMFKLAAQVVICGNNRHSDMKHYHQYMDYLWRNREQNNAIFKGYEDYLQIPLQPLSDNLESGTYEIFEMDPVKYAEYQKAIYSCLIDRISDEEKETKSAVLIVAGAGRGPIVRSALAAAKNAERKVKVYAVEKNPNAIVTLQAQQFEMWGEDVTVVPCDMREWDPPEKADILISELLGSFGDNELSPECLDGAQRFLKDDGISIPSRYSSFLAPVNAPKLYGEIVLMREKDKHPFTYFETPFVVHLCNYTQLANPQEVFTFVHPNKVDVPDNARYERLVFKVPFNCTVHGFAGFFDAVLYKDIKLSIHPKTHTPGMFSWFPIFFPIKDPVYVRPQDELEIHFWRCISPRHVWYEWIITKPSIGTLHNPNGRSCTIGL